MPDRLQGLRGSNLGDIGETPGAVDGQFTDVERNVGGELVAVLAGDEHVLQAHFSKLANGGVDAASPGFEGEDLVGPADLDQLLDVGAGGGVVAAHVDQMPQNAPQGSPLHQVDRRLVVERKPVAERVDRQTGRIERVALGVRLVVACSVPTPEEARLRECGGGCQGGVAPSSVPGEPAVQVGVGAVGVGRCEPRAAQASGKVDAQQRRESASRAAIEQGVEPAVGGVGLSVSVFEGEEAYEDGEAGPGRWRQRGAVEPIAFGAVQTGVDRFDQERECLRQCDRGIRREGAGGAHTGGGGAAGFVAIAGDECESSSEDVEGKAEAVGIGRRRGRCAFEKGAGAVGKAEGEVEASDGEFQPTAGDGGECDVAERWDGIEVDGRPGARAGEPGDGGGAEADDGFDPAVRMFGELRPDPFDEVVGGPIGLVQRELVGAPEQTRHGGGLPAGGELGEVFRCPFDLGVCRHESRGPNEAGASVVGIAPGREIEAVGREPAGDLFEEFEGGGETLSGRGVRIGQGGRALQPLCPSEKFERGRLRLRVESVRFEGGTSQGQIGVEGGGGIGLPRAKPPSPVHQCIEPVLDERGSCIEGSQAGECGSDGGEGETVGAVGHRGGGRIGPRPAEGGQGLGESGDLGEGPSDQLAEERTGGGSVEPGECGDDRLRRFAHAIEGRVETFGGGPAVERQVFEEGGSEVGEGVG